MTKVTIIKNHGPIAAGSSVELVSNQGDTSNVRHKGIVLNIPNEVIATPPTDSEGLQDGLPEHARMEVSEAAEQIARDFYDDYVLAVGGKAFNGDTLPTSEEFFTDPAKQKQANGYRYAAENLIHSLKEGLYDLSETKSDDLGTTEVIQSGDFLPSSEQPPEEKEPNFKSTVVEGQWDIPKADEASPSDHETQTPSDSTKVENSEQLQEFVENAEPGDVAELKEGTYTLPADKKEDDVL